MIRLSRLRLAPALLVAVLALAVPAWSQTAPAPTPVDGVWTGRAAGSGSACGALDVRITIEGGLLDGTATEPDGGAPRVQGKRGETLPPPPALWQLNGRVGANGVIDIIGLRSMKDRERQRSRWSGRTSPGTLSVAETDGPCRRAATLARSR